MIRFFNVNNPAVIPFLFLFTVVVNLVIFIMPENFSLNEVNAPFSRLFFQFTGILFNNNYYALAAIAMLLSFTQALMLNVIVNNAKLFEAGSYVPALIYLLTVCLFREFLFISPALLALTFIIPAIGKTMQFFKNQRCFAQVFDMGLLIGIASLFYKPAFLLMILLFIALFVMRAFNWREWVIGLSGFLTIYFLTGTYFFLTDDLDIFFYQFILAYSLDSGGFISTPLSLWVVGSMSLILVICSLIVFFLNFLKSPVHARKFLVLILWTALLMGISVLFARKPSLNHFVLLSVPLSIIISYLLLNIKKVRIANIVHFLWLAVVLFFQYFLSK